jgi:hypothetical protein
MAEKTDWEAKAANLLKAELKRKGVTYAQLAERIGDKEVNVATSCHAGSSARPPFAIEKQVPVKKEIYRTDKFAIVKALSRNCLCYRVHKVVRPHAHGAKVSV